MDEGGSRIAGGRGGATHRSMHGARAPVGPHTSETPSRWQPQVAFRCRPLRADAKLDRQIASSARRRRWRCTRVPAAFGNEAIGVRWRADLTRNAFCALLSAATYTAHPKKVASMSLSTQGPFPFRQPRLYLYSQPMAVLTRGNHPQSGNRRTHSDTGRRGPASNRLVRLPRVQGAEGGGAHVCPPPSGTKQSG